MLSQTLTTQPSTHPLSFTLPPDLSLDSPDDKLAIPQYPKKSGKWTQEEDDLLRKYVDLLGEKQWRKISEHIPGRTSIQCLHRWSKILRPGLVKGPWTPEEDQKLIAWVKAEGPNKWANAANIISGRSGKQCRERWFNNLNPEVKKCEWTKEEDELIFELYQKHGSSWSKIAKLVPGRTENSIKNRFYSTLRKITADKKKTNKVRSTPSEPTEEDMEEEGSIKSGEEAQLPHTLYKLLQGTMQGEEEETDEAEHEEKKSMASPNKKVTTMETESPVDRAPQEQSSEVSSQCGLGSEESLSRMASHGKEGSPQGNLKRLVFSLDERMKENSQQRMSAIPLLNVRQQDFKPILPVIQRNASASDLHIPSLSNVAVQRPVLKKQDTSDLSNLIEIKLADERENPFSGTFDFKVAPLRFAPNALYKNPQPLNLNLTSKGSPQPSPLNLSRLGSMNLSETSSMGLPVMRCFSEQPDSPSNSGILQGLKTKKEISQSSQSTQGSVYETNEGLPDMYKLFAMSKVVQKASSLQQDCFSNIKNMCNGNQQMDQNETRMTLLFNQLHSLDGLFSNTKGKLQRLESALNQRMSARQEFVKVETENGEIQEKRMLLEMMRQRSINQRDAFEMSTVVKKVKIN